MFAALSKRDSLRKEHIVAKGMAKRGREEKKPKKEAVKVVAAAPSMKNAVVVTATKAKPK